MNTVVFEKIGGSVPARMSRAVTGSLILIAVIAFAGGARTAFAVVNHPPSITWSYTGDPNAANPLGPDQRIGSSGSFATEYVTVDDGAETAVANLGVTVSVLPIYGWTASTKPNVTVTGSGALRTVNIPTPNTAGAATVILTLTDQGSPARSAYFSFTLQKVSTSSSSGPSLGRIPSEAVPVGSAYGPIAFVIDNGSDVSPCTPTWTSSSSTIFPSGSVTITGSNRAYIITATPATAGSAAIVLTEGAVGACGAAADTSSFTSFVVDAVVQTPTTNYAPAISASPPSSPVYYQVASELTSLPTPTPSPFTFSVSDIETTNSNLRFTATSSNPHLVPNDPSSFIFTGTSTTGSIAINPTLNEWGASTITVSVSDDRYTRRMQFLYIVKGGTDDFTTLYARPSGLYSLDTSSNYSYVTGQLFRYRWCNAETGFNQYNFNDIDQLLADGGTLLTNQLLSISLIQEPGYIVDPAYNLHLTSWCDTDPPPPGQNCNTQSACMDGGNSGFSRAVPWDPYLRQRRHAYLAALAGNTYTYLGATTRFADDPRLEVINTNLPGGDVGIRDPAPRPYSEMMNYSRANLLASIQDELRTAQDKFPGKFIQIGFWDTVQDGNLCGALCQTPGTCEKELWEYIHDKLAAEFNGVERPRIGFFQENLAATRLEAAPNYVHAATTDDGTPPPYTSTPHPDFLPTFAIDPPDTNSWLSFQALTPWKSPFKANQFPNTVNGSPNDGIEADYNKYYGEYHEIYSQDFDRPSSVATPWEFWKANFQGWHDYMATQRSFPPPEPIAGVTVLPDNAITNTNTISWRAAARSVPSTTYDVQYETGAGIGNWTSVPSSPFTGTSCTHVASSAYYYRVSVHGAGKWSIPTGGMLFLGGSDAAGDGFVTASAKNSSKSTSDGIRAGNLTSSPFDVVKGILSFTTSALPDSAVNNPIVSAKLRLKQGSTDDPFLAFGYCRVDIKQGGFNGNIGLETADFCTAPADAYDIGEVPPAGVNGWTEVRLDPEAFPFINRTAVVGTGRTQFRVYFDNPAGSSFASWYPGDSNTTNQPQLIVQLTEGP